MKIAVNMKLKESTISLLDSLSKELTISKTEVVERAIEFYSRDKSIKHNELMAFAGMLDDDSAVDILESITESRVDKGFVPDI